MTDGILDTDTAKMLVSYIERIEKMEEEKKAIADDIKNEFLGAKAQGFDTGIMRKILRLRQKPADELQEEEALLEAYRLALGMA